MSTSGTTSGTTLATSSVTSSSEPNPSSSDGLLDTSSESTGETRGLDPCSSEAQFVAVAFDIRFGGTNSLDDLNGWLNRDAPRRDRVIDIIRDMAPDLLGVQEALANQVDDLTAGLPEFGFVGVGRDDGDRAGEFMGVFYRLTRFELRDEGHFWLSDTPETPGTVFPGSGSNRMATWVLLWDREVERELLLLNTHWDNVSQSSRELSASLIRTRLQGLANGRPVVFTGDLNAAEDNQAVLTLLADEPGPPLIDGYRQVFPTPPGPEGTFHGFSGDMSGARIDYVLHDAQLRTVAASIRTDRIAGRFPSDHFPVTADLAWSLDDDGQPCPR